MESVSVWDILGHGAVDTGEIRNHVQNITEP